MSSAIILFSGGLDSTVMLAKALSQNVQCYPIFFLYGQKHLIELESAIKIADHYQVTLKQVTITLDWSSHSSLTSEHLHKDTYVPARNTLFLAYATGFAEVLKADEIHLGCNSIDTINYPDCRPDFIFAFQQVLKNATKSCKPIKLVTPLQTLNKSDIVDLGRRLNAPLHLTWSCYNPQSDKTSCNICSACLLRSEVLF